jgi:hypothetical protein
VANSEIADNAVTTAKIQDGTVQRVDVAFNFKAPDADIADTVRRAPPTVVADGSITNAKLAPNAVTTDKILDGTIQRSDVATNFKAPDADIADTVRRAPPTVVADGSITNAKLAPNAVTTDKILDGTVQRSDVASNFKAPDADIADTVRRAPPTVVADGSITNAKLAPNAVTTDKILDGTIQRADVASNFKAPNADIADTVRKAPLTVVPDGSITSAKIADSDVQTIDIADGAITQGKLAGNSVTNAKILNGAVSEQKIADANVTSSKIADNAISALKLDNLSVSTAKIQDGAVTNSKVQDGAVTSEKIQNYSIRTEDVAPDFRPPRSANADSVNGITAAFQQRPFSLFPLNSNGGLTLASSPSMYEALSIKRAKRQGGNALLDLISGAAGCALDELGLGIFQCAYDVGFRVGTDLAGGPPIGGSFGGRTYGVEAISDNGTALYAHSTSGLGLWASSIGSPAARFDGNVQINGSLNATGQLQATGFKLTTSPQNGYVLTSDANGVGTWRAASGGGPGITQLNQGTGISLSPSPITSTGTVSLASNYEDGSRWDSRFINESQSFGGDVTGIFSGLTVTRIQTKPVSSTAPSSGQVLKWDGSQWAPGTDISGGISFPFSYTGSSSSPLFSITNNGAADAIDGTSANSGYSGLAGFNSTSGTGTFGQSSSGRGVFGTSSSYVGVYGQAGSGGAGVYGTSSSTYAAVEGSSSNSAAVYGHTTSSSYAGVEGSNSNNTGVYGHTTSSSYAGVTGSNSSGTGIFGSTTSGYGVYGSNNNSNTTGYAGYFYGRTYVNGILFAGAKPFKIDHPLDPANKYLYHIAVESPDMKNIYDGVSVLDANGEAVVELPNYFEALNMEFRYQLTCIGSFAQIYIAQEIQNNRFKIAGGKAGIKVSWQVTGIRKDAFANANRIIPEVEKEPENKGKYLYPKELGKPETSGIDWNRIEQPKTVLMKTEEK